VLGPSPELPAATTTTFPFSTTARLTDRLMASWPSEATELPRLMEITLTFGRSAHQSIPAITWVAVPDPWAFRTLATDRLAPGATPPKVAAWEPPVPSPAAMDATCVPWPWSS
jgi:hypothetical protein